MILVDANLLLYAYDSASPYHVRARAWWEEKLSQADPVRLSWSSVVAFVRIITHPAIGNSMTVEEATEIVDEWLSRPMVSVLDSTERHWPILRTLLVDSQARGNVITDAHLAALAREHGATICTNDRDFARFSEIRVEYPLAR